MAVRPCRTGVVMQSEQPIQAPQYPVRRPEGFAALESRYYRGDWTRLEGAPETETALRAYHGGGHIWYLTSGTAALEALLLGHEIGPGDHVVTTPYTWGATIAAILAVGAIPVFADIDRETGLLDVATVERCIGPKTRAILSVHLFGNACDNAALAAIAKRWGIYYFEDGSQAHGALYRGERVGRGGDGAAFSCMGLKPLAGSEGGYAIFENARAYEIAALYGRHPRGLEPEVAERLQGEGLLDSLQLGWRPCAFGADLVRAQLPFLEAELAAKRANIAVLRAELEGFRPLRLPAEPADTSGAHHLLSFLFDPAAAGCDRATAQQKLRAAGVGCFVYIPTPLHRLRRLMWRGYTGPRVLWHAQLERDGMDYAAVQCPSAEWRSAHALEMTFNWTEAAPEAMRQLAAAIRSAFEH